MAGTSPAMTIRQGQTLCAQVFIGEEFAPKSPPGQNPGGGASEASEAILDGIGARDHRRHRSAPRAPLQDVDRIFYRLQADYELAERKCVIGDKLKAIRRWTT
jgi:hypothetical protein